MCPVCEEQKGNPPLLMWLLVCHPRALAHGGCPQFFVALPMPSSSEQPVSGQSTPAFFSSLPSLTPCCSQPIAITSFSTYRQASGGHLSATMPILLTERLSGLSSTPPTKFVGELNDKDGRSVHKYLRLIPTECGGNHF